MTRITFSEDTASMNFDAFFNLLEHKLSKAAPELLAHMQKKGAMEVYRFVQGIVFPKNASETDSKLLDFCELYYALGIRTEDTEVFSRSISVYLPPDLHDFTYDKSSRLVNSLIYTPKGGKTESFLKEYKFPHAVTDGYPVIAGKQIKPNGSVQLFLDAEGVDEKGIAPASMQGSVHKSRHKADSSRMSASGHSRSVWRILGAALLGLAIAATLIRLVLCFVG